MKAFSLQIMYGKIWRLKGGVVGIIVHVCAL